MSDSQQMGIYHQSEISIAADADGSRDAAHAQQTIALYTELDAESDQQATIVRRC